MRPKRRNMNKKSIRGRAVTAAVLAVLVAGVCFYSGIKPNQAAGKQVMTDQVSHQASSQAKIPAAGTQNPETAAEPKKAEEQIIIALDPGHQGPEAGMSGEEEDGPGSGILKAKTTSGTTGRFTGLAEYQLNLEISEKVKTCLTDRGYQVVMTRENHETSVSNQDRAKIANDSGAKLCVRIHANGSESPESAGALCLVMSPENPFVGTLYDESFKLAEDVLNSYCTATGIYNRGVQTDDTMTGINWSKIPVIILEMGFMTNQQDDIQMADPKFQQKMAEGIADGIEAYISN